MITVTQAQQYLDQALGITVPQYVVQAACDKVETAEPAMIDAGYSEETQMLVQSMAVALVSGADFARRTASQRAPSGADRGLKYNDDAMTALRRALDALDTADTVADIVGPNPVTATMFAVIC